MRFLLFSILIISFSFSISAQAIIKIDSINGQDITNSQLIIDTIPNANIALPHLYIINNSGADQNWMVTRKNIIQPNDWFNYLCWGALCYSASPSNVWSSSVALLVSGSARELDLYVGAPKSDSAHYRYYISTDGINFIDSLDVFVNATSTVGFDAVVNQDLKLFPNPAKGRIFINKPSISSYRLTVYDYSGRQVISNKNLRVNQIDISHLKNGFYIFYLENTLTDQKIKQKVIIAN